MTAEGVNLLRTLAPQVLGAVVRRYGSFSLAEDAVQEALLVAATRWPEEGVPDHPRAWLVQVASRRLADQLRAEAARRRREDAVMEAAVLEAPAPDEGGAPTGADADDTLLLLFMCCHPSLTRSTAIALTLRAVGGLTTEEIARAFLVPDATMGQRISRAKQTIQKSGIQLAMPEPSEKRERLSAVLHVLYLIFNEGYTSQRVDLAAEAIRLARAVVRELPEDGEAIGLLALMLLTDARREARTDADGGIVPLDEQDRARWDRERIAEGVALVERALARGEVGAYQIQAAIAAIHDEAPSVDETDWAQIAGFYGLLERMSDNPMVTLGRAVAVAMVQGPDAGLALAASLDADPRVAAHHRLAAVKAHLYERKGDVPAAIRHYRAAASATTSMPERSYLEMKAAKLAHPEK